MTDDALKRTYIAPESDAYPTGGQTRKCRAICQDGKVRTVYAGIPDTAFTIPAHTRIVGKYARGYVYQQDNPDLPDYGELMFYRYSSKHYRNPAERKEESVQ